MARCTGEKMPPFLRDPLVGGELIGEFDHGHVAVAEAVRNFVRARFGFDLFEFVGEPPDCIGVLM